LKNTTNENKINLSLIAYDDSKNSATKLTQKQILFEQTKIPSPFETKVINKDY